MHATPETGTPGKYLLSGADASSRCLTCHAGTAASATSVLTTALPLGSPPVNYTPGGDFAWLEKSFTWAEGSSPGARHGHNVVAADFGLDADPDRLRAPGGSFPSSALACTSCHDPHGGYRVSSSGTTSRTGKPIRASGSLGGESFAAPDAETSVGSYRLLAGDGYVPDPASGITFHAPPPVAIAPPAFNQSERTADVRVAYGTGMSEWCGNCHGALHTPAALDPTALSHPVGSSALLGTAITNVYNAYVKTGDLSGSWVTSYTTLVPYEEGTSDRAVLASRANSDGSVRTGPSTGGENVMCLTCHRAHSTAWDHALRWNQKSEYIVVGGQWPGIDATGDAARPEFAQGRTTAETRAAMYDREPSRFGAYEVVLCSKCHAK